jgi:hypothetical protein
VQKYQSIEMEIKPFGVKVLIGGKPVLTRRFVVEGGVDQFTTITLELFNEDDDKPTTVRGALVPLDEPAGKE